MVQFLSLTVNFLHGLILVGQEVPVFVTEAELKGVTTDTSFSLEWKCKFTDLLKYGG